MTTDDLSKKPAPQPDQGSATTDLRSRFATPIEADQPVNPDEKAGEAFTAIPAVEQDARNSRPKSS